MDKDNPDVVAVTIHPASQGTWDLHSEKVETATQVDPAEIRKQTKGNIKRTVATFASEFMAEFVLVFLGCMGCASGMAHGGKIPHESICWGFGLAVLISVHCFGHISGSHLSAAVTLASIILGYTSFMRSIVYFLGQFTGAFAAYATVYALTPLKFIKVKETYTAYDGTVQKKPGLCSPFINPNISVFQAVMVEFVATGFLVLVCCSVWDRRNQHHHDSVSIRFGLAVMVLALVTGPYTGANMNPARSLAPVAFNGDWAYHWVYWIGPLAGSVFFAYLYKFLFQPPPLEIP